MNGSIFFEKKENPFFNFFFIFFNLFIFPFFFLFFLIIWKEGFEKKKKNVFEDSIPTIKTKSRKKILFVSKNLKNFDKKKKKFDHKYRRYKSNLNKKSRMQYHFPFQMINKYL